MIRLARKEDIVLISSLITTSNEGKSLSQEFSGEVLTSLIKNKGVFLVEEGEVLGFLLGRFEEEAEILSVFVKPEDRKKGMGSMLVNAFEEEAVKRKCKTIKVFAEETQLILFNLLNYKKGRTHTIFQKRL